MIVLGILSTLNYKGASSLTEEEQLICLSSETSLKLRFPTVSIPQFLIGVQGGCDKQQITITSKCGTWSKSGCFGN
jgi:hypothetical protein